MGGVILAEVVTFVYVSRSDVPTAARLPCINVPPTVNHHPIFVGDRMCLILIASLAQRLGIAVRGIDAIIKIASIIHRTNGWWRARMTESSGNNNLNYDKLKLRVIRWQAGCSLTCFFQNCGEAFPQGRVTWKTNTNQKW